MRDKIKKIFHKHGIQFRKIDPRRSENIVLDINKDCLREQKKILICYLEYGRSTYSLRNSNVHTNLSEMMQIIKILIDLDYRIDVCGCANEDAIMEMPHNYYDYIFGFGKVYKYAKKVNPQAFSIIYMTENPYNISYQAEQERIAYFKERTGKLISMNRTGKYYQDGDERDADAVICLGETKHFSDIQKPLYRIYPSGFMRNMYENDTTKRKKNYFLVFGVKGFVHKGNDLLIEIFTKHPEWELFLCGNEIQKECRELGYKLSNNIHDCGFVDVSSNQFLELVEKCSFTLLPSCSEGMSTALLTCMCHGLIPVTMRGTGMDELEKYCMYFEGFRLEQIENKIKQIQELSQNEINEMSEKLYCYCRNQFSLQKYTDHMREILTQILL